MITSFEIERVAVDLFLAEDRVLLGERHVLRLHGDLWVVYDNLGTIRVVAHELFEAATWFALMERGVLPPEPFAFVADRPDAEVVMISDIARRAALTRSLNARRKTDPVMPVGPALPSVP